MFKKIKKEFVSERKRKVKYLSSAEEALSPYDDIANQMDSELKQLNDMIEWLEKKDSARSKNVQNSNHVLQVGDLWSITNYLFVCFDHAVMLN